MTAQNFRLPVWDPSVAASAGAGFADVLGALLLAATFQIAIQTPPQKSARLASLAVAPVALTLLLIAAYLYVVLSGTVGISADDRLIARCQMAITAVDCAALSVPAAMFAIAGSYLGMGAIALGFTLRLDAQEHENASAGEMATLVLFYGGSIVAFLALTWGYRDARSVILAENLSIKQFLLDQHGLPWAVAGALVGYGFARKATSEAKRRRPRPRRQWTERLMLLAVVAYVTLPVYWYLLIQETDFPAGQSPAGSAFLAQAMLAWVSAGFAACLELLRLNSVELASESQG